MSAARRCDICGTEIPPNAPAGQCPKCMVRAGFESAGSAHSGTGSTAASPAGGGFEAPSVEELGQRFPHLEILELLGKGGMGAVYKARQTGLSRLVAVKILPAEVGSAPAFAERFTREARALAHLSHPNIVAVYDFGQSGGLFYIVMEYIDGANLRQTMQAARLTPEQALAIVPQICDALQYAHDEGVVHRDIKPENILLDKRGRVKIADFGLAKLLRLDRPDVSLTGEHQVMGTLRYMAPEQMQGTKAVDHRADIYSLGVVFYELLTGDLPMGRFAPPSKKVRIDVRLDDVVLRALEEEPAMRYQQAKEIRTQVDSISGISPAALESLRLAMGREYKSKTTIFGIPLLHVATGIDPATGRRRVAKGIIALGDTAFGVVAAGGCAMGGITFGGVSLGVVSCGGLALGILLAIGGLAVGGSAFGGLAIGIVAIGGGTLGYYALGGEALGVHVSDSAGRDAQAQAFFEGWGERWPEWLALIGLLTPLGCIAVAVIIWLTLRRETATSGLKPNDATANPAAPSTVRPASSEAELEAARQEVKIPAIGLMVFGVLTGVLVAASLGFSSLMFVRTVQLHHAAVQQTFDGTQIFRETPQTHLAKSWLPILLLLGAGLSLLLGVAFTWIGWKMLQLRAYGLAVAASMVALLPCQPLFIVGLAVGIWSLIVLNRPHVRQAFEQMRQPLHR